MTSPPGRNPFQSGGLWLKGAIHTHTTNSDGRVSPEQARSVYAADGFDFIVFGDHWRVSELPDAPGLPLVIPGAEYDARLPGGGPAGFHFMAVGMPAGHEEPLRALRDSPAAMAEALAGLCPYLVLAHPYWSALTTELIGPLKACAALEVYNHGCEVEDGLGYSMYVWDQLLARGHRWDALAVDDAHWRRDDDHGGGWVMVKTDQRSPAAVIAALKAGRFYSSSGPVIHQVELAAPRRLRVRCSPARSILFRCNRSLGDGLRGAPAGECITQAEHDIPPEAVFARVEVTDPVGRKAWTNPFYFDE